MKNTNNKEIEISKVFDAPAKDVWDAWTNPEKIMKWWGPEGFTSPFCEVDLHVGSKYLYCMRGKAAPEQPVMDYWSGGEYKEIVPYKKIVCTDYFANEKGEKIDPTVYGFSSNFPKENIVNITFEEIDGETRVTILYKNLSKSALEEMTNVKMREGWESSLLKLVGVL